MKIIKNYVNKYLQYYNIFLKEDQKRYYFIYLPSHFFIIPSACALFNENYTIWFFSSCIMITSLLTWGHIHNKLYYTIDIFLVRICFLIMLCSSIINIIIDKKDFFIHFFLFCLLIQVVILYSLGVLLHNLCIKYNVIFHILMHFTAIFSILYCIYFKYNVFETIEIICKGIIRMLKGFQYLL